MVVYDGLAAKLIGHWRGPKDTPLAVQADLYLIGSYVYYVLEDEWFLSDEDFDGVCQTLLSNYDGFTRGRTMHSQCFSRDALQAGTGYSINPYPTRIKDLSRAVLRLYNKEQMATKIEEAKPVVREITLQDLPCRLTFDETGISLVRKGDRHVVKRSLRINWDDLLDYLDPVEQDGTPVEMDDDYEPHGFLEKY